MNELQILVQIAEKLGPALGSPLVGIVVLVGLVTVLRRTGALANDTTNAVQSTTSQLGLQISNLTQVIGDLRRSMDELARQLREIELAHVRIDESVKVLERIASRPPSSS